MTLDFGSGHDLTVREFEPHIGLRTDSVEPAWDSLSPSLPLSRPTPPRNEYINLKKKKKDSLFSRQQTPPERGSGSLGPRGPQSSLILPGRPSQSQHHTASESLIPASGAGRTTPLSSSSFCHSVTSVWADLGRGLSVLWALIPAPAKPGMEPDGPSVMTSH